MSFTFYFAPYSEEYESKIFLSNGPFPMFFYPMFANCVHAISASLLTLLNVKIIFDQFLAKLLWNATEIVRFLKTFEIWVFFEKIIEFFEKKLEFSQNP